MNRRALLVLEATIGGTRRHLRDLALGLSARGWTLHIAYAARREKDFLRDVALFREKGIACTEIDMKRSPAPVSDGAAILRLRHLIRDFKPDVIHLHSTKAGLLGRLASIGSGAKVLYTPHCFAFEMESSLRKLYFFMEKALVPLTDAVIAVCDGEAAAAQRLGYRPDAIHRIYNGIPEHSLHGGNGAPQPTPQDTPGRNMDATPHGDDGTPPPPAPAFCFIGRNCRQKGVDLLLKAFLKLKDLAPDAELTVMSDLDDALYAQFKDTGATTLPFGSPEAVDAVLREADVLVMPSRWEAFPYTPLEAFAAGLPVIAFDVGGVREAVRDHENGLLVPKGDTDALAAAMRDLLTSPALRARLVRGAAASARAFPLSRMLDETEQVYCKTDSFVV